MGGLDAVALGVGQALDLHVEVDGRHEPSPIPSSLGAFQGRTTGRWRRSRERASGRHALAELRPDWANCRYTSGGC
jgi:hypothetical protein